MQQYRALPDQPAPRMSNDLASPQGSDPVIKTITAAALDELSGKAVALFGDTKPIKDALSDLGGRFNGRLTYRGEKCAGWVFPKAKEMQVRELIGMTE